MSKLRIAHENRVLSFSIHNLQFYVIEKKDKKYRKKKTEYEREKGENDREIERERKKMSSHWV